MAIKLTGAVLITDKLAQMKAFYADVMKLSVEMDFGNCVAFEGGLSLWKLTEDYPAAKALGSTIFDAANKNMEVCFETDEFGEEAARIKQSGAALLHDIETEKWGQQTIRFYDPDCNLVELGESMPCFCRRLQSSGMNIAQVAAHTGIPEQGVRAFLGEV